MEITTVPSAMAEKESPSGPKWDPVGARRAFSIKRFLFAIISRVGIAAYSRFPIFGPLRASLAVIKNADEVLVIDRSDGRGLSFPGGLALPWETPEQALEREIFEETGLRVKQSTTLFSYYATDDIPCNITVFTVEAEGSLKDSWEGSPSWLTLDEIQMAVIRSQQEIVSRLV